MAAANDKTLLGFWLMMPSLTACEMGAYLGYDFVVLDMEHGLIDAETADRMIGLGKALGLKTYSRVASADRVPIQHALDAGADAVIIPQIRDAEHARIAASYTKYPPLGTRGVGYSRISKYGGMSADFIEAENRRTQCCVMIETQGAFDDVAKIAALPAVDNVFIGPGDLSMTRGRGPNRDTPEDSADHDRIIKATQAAGKPWSMAAGHPKRRKMAIERGASFITISDDLSALYSGLATALKPPA